MSWLVSTKVLPAFAAGRPPTYHDILPKTTVNPPEPVKWTIRWDGTDIGWAENKISRNSDGTGKIASEVRFQQLPVDALLRDAMGFMGRFAAGLTGEIGPIDLHVFTDLDFDNYGTLSHFETRIDLGTLADLLTVEGHVKEDKLDLTARVRSDGDESTEVYRRREIRLPADALVADTFSPRPKLTGLQVGQSWTFQSYQPFVPYNPLTLIEAKVVGEELIEWKGAMTRAKKVVFQKDSGSGISTTRRPVSESWVADDGTVLRQEIWLANIKVQFIRETPTTALPNLSNETR